MLYLASKSPRRAELLQQIGVEFKLIEGEIDESSRPDETIVDLVVRLSQQKARQGYANLQKPDAEDWVLAADTMIALDQQIIGKPDSESHCCEIISSLSGREHQVLTAVALCGQGDSIRHYCSTSSIRFRDITADEIESYCRLDEPHDKAGAYAIQGFAAIFIESIQGSYSAVMGLPLYETAMLLKKAGFNLLK